MSNENFVNTVNITKEEFLNVFKTIEKYQKHSAVLNDAIRTVGDGYFMFDAAESLVALFVNYWVLSWTHQRIQTTEMTLNTIFMNLLMLQLLWTKKNINLTHQKHCMTIFTK